MGYWCGYWLQVLSSDLNYAEYMLWEESQLFHAVDASSRNELGAIMRRKNLAKEEMLFFYEDKGNFVYIINSGKIKLNRQTQDGKESVIMVAIQGDILGEELLFGKEQYSYSAVAVTEAELFAFSVPELRLIMKSSTVIADNAAQLLLKRNYQLQKELEHLKVQNAQQKIGCFLLDNSKTHYGTANFELPFEKNMIAAKLGMKPETFSRALADLKKQGVHTDGKVIIIEDVRRLAHYTCASCSEHFPCNDLG